MTRPSFSRAHAPAVFFLMTFVLAFAAVSLLFVTRAEDKTAKPKAEPVLPQEAKALEDALGQLEAELNNRLSRAEANSPADNDSASALDHALSQLRRRLVNLKNRIESVGLDPGAALGLRNRASILEDRINRREAQKRRASRPAATVNKDVGKGMRLAPAATGAISGTVTDSATLLSVINVTIEIYNSTGAFIANTTTDGSGNYTSPAVLATGNYFVRTTNTQGYINEVYNNITCVICNPTSGTAVAVTDGATTTGINFALAPGGRISGTVTNALSAAPLSGVNVQILDSGGAFVANGFTDGSGNYISDAGLPAGSYFARTNNSQGFIDKLYNNITCAPCNQTSGTPITVTGTATTAGINFALNAGGRISGNVSDASSAAAIANVNVNIFNSTGAFVTSGFTDGSGNYITPNGLLPGNYFASTFNSSGYVNKLYNNITCVSCNVTSGTPITVNAGATTSGINFALNLGGRISGTVTDATTSTPLANVDVQIFNSSGAFVTSGFTDNLGNYTSSSGLLPGNHFVKTNNLLGYIDEVYNNITCLNCNVTSGTPVSVTAGSTTSGISFALNAGGRIAGTVTSSATSALLTNISIDIFDASGFTVSGGFTDGAGNYISSKGLTPGTYFARTRNTLGFIDEVYNNITCLNCIVTSGTPITVTAGATTSGINFALATGGRISGNITDGGTAAPLAGINVNIHNATGQFVSSGFTDGLGNYITDGGLPSGTYFALTSNFAGYVNKLYNNITCMTCNVTSGTPITVTAGSTTSGISFALNAGGRISGTITDATTAAPIANVNVQILNSSGQFVSNGFTDNGGQYLSSAGLTTGNYFVLTQNSQGYVNEVYNNITCAPCNPTSGTAVSVTAGATTSGISFALNAGGRISGTVTDSATSAPLSNVNVQIFNSSGAFITGVFTDSSGNYLTQEGLLAGTYYATADSPFGYIKELYNNITCFPNCNVTTGTAITVTTGATTSGINFALAPGGSISGTVTDATTLAGIGGASVTIFDPLGFQVAFGATNGAGNYNTNVGLPTGTYFARTNNSSGYINEIYNNITCLNCNVTTGTPISVTAGSATSGINFALVTGGRISGTVTDAATTLPIANAQVEIFDASNFFLGSFNTDGSGNYLTDGLPAGTYFARTRNSAGYINKLYNNIVCTDCNATTGTPINVTVGSTTAGINFSLNAGGRISGMVTDSATSAPLSNVNVEIFNSTGAFVANGFTDNAGNYISNGGLPAGNYFARTRNQSGYIEKLYNNITCLICNVTTGTAISVTVGSTTTGINFSLTLGGRISGTVTDAATSAPITNTEVRIFNSAGTQVSNGFSNNTGSYTISGGLPAGTYFARTNSFSGYLDKLYNNIDCSTGCNPATGTPITVSVGSTTSGINFALNAGGRISGTVTDSATSLAIANVQVQIFNNGGGFVTTVSTDASGNYITPASLPTGNYFALTNNSLGYINELYNNITCVSCNVTTGTPISVTAGATTSGINFALALGGRISGTVTDSATSAPLANVQVEISNSSGVVVTNANTDGSGNYISGGGLPAGNYFARTRNSSGYVNKLYNNITCVSCNVTTGTPIAATVGSTTSGINFALALGGRISGTVTDSATSAPIANVNVQIFNSTGLFMESGFTDSAGNYICNGGLPAGNYFARTGNSQGFIDELYNNITCFPNCNVTTGTPIAVTVGTTTSGINFGLNAGGRISGTVTDAATSAPLANVNVQVFNSSGTFIVGVNTNASGSYTVLTGLPAGNYFLRTTNSLGYINELYNNITCFPSCTVTTGTPVAVTAGVTTSGIDFALAQGGAISGTVTDAGTSAPIANVNVQIFNSGGVSIGSVNTDGSGNYSFGGLTTGTYFARTNNSLGYINEIYNNINCVVNCNVTTGTPISVTTGSTTSGINFALVLGGQISGTVTDSSTSAPLANITVQILDSTGLLILNINTDGSGNYITNIGLLSGTYFARTNNNQGYVNEVYNNITCVPCNPTSGTPITVTTGTTTSGINFALAPGGRISGTVTDVATSLPIANTQVQIRNTSGTVVANANTNASGNYQVNIGLPAGNYFARTNSQQGYINEIYNNIDCMTCNQTSGTPIAVTAGNITTGINFSLTLGGRISGTVTDATTSAPIEGIFVEVYNSAGVFVFGAGTDPSGNFLTGPGLLAGNYFLRAVGETGYIQELYNNLDCAGCQITSGTPVAVTLGATTPNINFSLTEGGLVSGTVTDAATSAPVVNAQVEIYNSCGQFVTVGITDSSGNYVIFDGLPTGSYFAATFSTPDHVLQVYNDITCVSCLLDATSGTPITVTAGKTTSGIDFALDRGGTITGTVTDAATGSALQGIGVSIFDTTGALVSQGNTNAEGRYISPVGLPTGTYFALTANNNGYVNEAYNDIACVGCTATASTPISVTTGDITPGIDFALTLGGRIYGNLTNASTTAPLINVAVQVYNSAGTIVTTVSTDSSGNYISRGGLPTGNYFVRTSNNQGLIDEVYNNIECAGCNVTTGTPVAVTVGSVTNGINFALGPGGRISGAVTNAVTTAPLRTIPVQIYNATGGLVTTGFTDCNGNYTSLAGMPTGTYYARTANTRGFGDVLYNNLPCANCDPVTGNAIAVTTGVTTPSINFALCAFSLSASSKHFPATGGEGSFAVSSAGTCGWAAASNAAWIEITSSPGGSGNGTLTYLVRDNLDPAPRTGTIIVAGRTFIVTQEGQTPASCTFTISPLFASFESTGGAGIINLTTAVGCAWKSESNRSWITITSSCCGIGNGTVNYTVAPNTTGSGRSGVITIAGKKFNVKQK